MSVEIPAPKDKMNGHYQALAKVMNTSNFNPIARWPTTLMIAERVFICGNGGSAAIASHFVVDLLKTVPTGPSVISLVDNSPVLTAIANDMSYDKVFSHQLAKHYSQGERDVLIAISSSGRSPNVVAAAEHALKVGMTVLTMTGFDTNNPLRSLGLATSNPGREAQLWVDSDNYGVVEDAHHICMHAVIAGCTELTEQVAAEIVGPDRILN